VPSSVHASPCAPEAEQNFRFAPLPVVLHVMFAGHMLLMKSQLTSQPHDALHETALHDEARP
jgi:hypothetical protein